MRVDKAVSIRLCFPVRLWPDSSQARNDVKGNGKSNVNSKSRSLAQGPALAPVRCAAKTALTRARDDTYSHSLPFILLPPSQPSHEGEDSRRRPYSHTPTLPHSYTPKLPYCGPGMEPGR